MELKTKIVPLCVGVLSLSVFLCAAIYAWNEPGLPAPAGNVAAPINIGGATQTKSGNLNISGNVGIGTTSPSQKLDVAGYIKGQTGLCMNNDCRDSWSSVSGSWTISGNNIYNSNIGNVGIGTTSPSRKLDVAGTVAVDYLRVDSQDGANEGGELQLAGSGSYGTFQIDNYQGNARIHTLASGKQFQVLGGTIYADGTGGNNYFAGNVGVGTAAPSQKLDVAGYVRGQTGLCIGADCRTAWPTTGTTINTPQSCPAGQWMVGIKKNATNEIVIDCTGGGTPPISPAGEKRIFVTSNAYPGSSIPNDGAADALCQSAAAASGMNAGGATYKALAYLGGREPSSVLSNTATSFVNWNHTNGTWTKNVVAGGASDFFTLEGTNYLKAQIKYNQFGNDASGTYVWTNFEPTAGGSYKKLDFWWGCFFYNCWVVTTPQSGPCLLKTTWQSNGYSHWATTYRKADFWYGNVGSIDVSWAHAGNLVNNCPTSHETTLTDCGSLENCVNNNSRALYCVEQ
ncbi:MAG: hypothetical protein WCX69_03540 [Candidatus Paceibacterota bacterium]